MCAEIDWEDWRKRIFRYIYYRRQIRDVQLCHDLTSQTLIKAWEAMATDRGAHTNFDAWLQRIAQHVVIDHHRWCSRRQFADLEEMDRWIPERVMDDCLAEMMIRGEQMTRIERAIHLLTELQEQAFRLRYEGYQYEEIAAAMDSSEGNVKGLVRRAEESIRRRLGLIESDTP